MSDIEENRDVAFDNIPSPWGRSTPCLICDENATHRSPVIDRPWVDKLPIIRWLRKLYVAPPRWTVVIRGKKLFCLKHFELAESLADNEVNERRYTQARLNGTEFMRVYAFNNGLKYEIRRVNGI